MNINNRTWIENKFQFNKTMNILEIGSFIVSGQETIQCRNTILPKVKHFIGLDMRPGLGVDIVSDAKNMPFKTNMFDAIICLDTLEHIDYPEKVLKECFRVTKLKGFLFLATVFQFPIHDYPNDYWRFTPFCIKFLLENSGYKVLEYEGIGGTKESPIVVRGIGEKTNDKI